MQTEMATNDTPTLDTSEYGSDNPPKATVSEAVRYPQDSTTTLKIGAIYEGRVNNIWGDDAHAPGRVFVALDSPYTKSKLTGVLDPEYQLTNRFFEGDVVYVMPTRENGDGYTLQEVEVVGDDERSSFYTPEPEQPEPESEPESEPDPTDDRAVELLAEDTEENPERHDVEAVEAEGDGDEQETADNIIAYACTLCDNDDPYTADTEDSVRRHVTISDDWRHSGRHGNESSVIVKGLTESGDLVEYERGETPGEATGEVSTEFMPDDLAQTDRDRAIVETITENPCKSVKAITQSAGKKLRDQHPDADDGGDDIEPVFGPHAEWLAGNLPHINHDEMAEWPARENIAKLKYYYGLSQSDIADRYNTLQPKISSLMRSLEINPGHTPTRTDRLNTLDHLADEFGYEWARDLRDTGEGDGDPDDDPVIVPPLEAEPDEPDEADDGEYAGPGPDESKEMNPDATEMFDTDDDTESEGESEMTTRTVGNKSYSGPVEGLDVSYQTFAERPAAQQADEDDEEQETEQDADAPDEPAQPYAEIVAGSDDVTDTFTIEWDDVAGEVVMDDAVERVHAQADRLASASQGGEMATYAAGLRDALDMLGLTGDDGADD